MGNMKYKNGGQKLLNKMAQYGYEVTLGNQNVKPMINADNKQGQFTSSKKPVKKMQIGGQSPSVTYSGTKKK